MKMCIHCGGDLVNGTKEMNLLEVDGHKFVAAVPMRRCSSCGEELVSGPVLEQLDLMIARTLAEYRDAIARVRLG